MEKVMAFSPLNRKADVSRIAIALLFVALVFVPLLRMFAYIDDESIRSVVSSPNFGLVIVNSLLAATLGTLITLVLAFFFACCTERTSIRFKAAFSLIFSLPMLIPSISNGMGLVILFGNNGIVTNAIGINIGIYGLKGIVLGSFLYAFPVAWLMFVDVMKYEDRSPYEAAEVLGISKWHQFWDITFPYLKKPLISIAFATFTMIITDYGVPLMVGGKFMTIPVVMYHEVIGRLDFGQGAVYGSLLLVPAVAAFLIDLFNRDKGNAAFVTKPFLPSEWRLEVTAAHICCVIMSAIVLLPLFSFLVAGFAKNYPADMAFTLDNIGNAVRLHADRYLLNSVEIAIATAFIGTTIAFLTAYLTARMKSQGSRFLHLAAIISAAVPGIVLGLSYALTFNGSFIYGTIAILVMANLVHFVATPYLMAYNSLSKLNADLEGVGQTLGISRWRMICDIFVPQCFATLLEMFAYFFVNCMMTISAVSFLAATTNKPVALMIDQFEAQMQLECAAIVSLAILAANLILKAVTCYWRKKRG